MKSEHFEKFKTRNELRELVLATALLGLLLLTIF